MCPLSFHLVSQEVVQYMLRMRMHGVSVCLCTPVMFRFFQGDREDGDYCLTVQADVLYCTVLSGKDKGKASLVLIDCCNHVANDHIQ